MSLTRTETWVPQPATQRSRRTPLAYSDKRNLLAYPSGRVLSVRNVDEPEKGWLFTQHLHPVTCVSFAPSGFWAASGDAGGQVRIWDTELKDNDEDISTKGPFAATSGKLGDIAWDFESKRVIAVGDGKQQLGHAFMFDSGNSVGEISGHSAAINAVAIRPTRPIRAVTVGEDGQVVFYEGPPFKFAKSESKHTNAVSDVAYSTDGNYFATAGFDRKVGLFDGKTGDFIRWVETGHTGSVIALSWKSGTELVTASADASVRLIQVEEQSEKLVHKWQLPAESSNQQTGVVATKDYIVSVALDGTLYYWSTASEEPARTVRGHQKTITALEAVESKTVYSGSIDGRILEWDVKTGQSTVKLTHDGPAVELTESTSGKLLSVGWDKKVFSVLGSDSIGSVKEQPIAFASDDNHTVVISESGLEVVGGKAIELKGRGTSVDIHKGLVAAGFGNEAVIYKAPDLDVVHSIGAQRSEVSSLKFSPDGQYLAIGDASGKVILYKTSDWSVVTSRWSFHTSRVTSIDWHPDSLRVVTGSTDSNIFVYSVEKPGRNVKSLGTHKDGVTRVAWVSPTEIVSGGNDGSIKLWKFTA